VDPPDLKALKARVSRLELAADKAKAAYEVLSDEAELDDYYPAEQAYLQAEVSVHRAGRKYHEALGKDKDAPKRWLARERFYKDTLAKSKDEERKLRSGKYRWDLSEGLVPVEGAPALVQPPVGRAPAPPAADPPDLKALKARALSLGRAADKAEAAYRVLSNEAELDDYYPVEQAYLLAEVRVYRAMRKYAAATGGKAARKAAKHWLAFERSFTHKLAKSKDEERKLRSGKYRWDLSEGLVPVEGAPALVQPPAQQAQRGADTPPSALFKDAVSPYSQIERDFSETFDPGGDESFHQMTGIPQYLEMAGALVGADVAPYPTQTEQAMGRSRRGAFFGLGEAKGGPPGKIFETHYEEELPGNLAGQTLAFVRQLDPQKQVELYGELSLVLPDKELDTGKAAKAFSEKELKLRDRAKKLGRLPEGKAELAKWSELGSTDVDKERLDAERLYLKFFKAEQDSARTRRAFVDVTNALTQIYEEDPSGWDEIVETRGRFDSRIGEEYPHAQLALSRIPRARGSSQLYLHYSRSPHEAARGLPEAYNALRVSLQSASPAQIVQLYRDVGLLMDKEEERARSLAGGIEASRHQVSIENSYIADPSPKGYPGEYTMGQQIRTPSSEFSFDLFGPAHSEPFGVEYLKRQQDAAYADLRRLGVLRALLHALVQSR
jgi:hypothetical protein